MIVLVWGVATLLGLLVAATTRIGPILVTVARTHGVHLGDAVAFLVCYLAAAALTLRIVRSTRFPRAGTARGESAAAHYSSGRHAQPRLPGRQRLDG
jgi:membrane protein DedA with SNARE-associated domain